MLAVATIIKMVNGPKLKHWFRFFISSQNNIFILWRKKMYVVKAKEVIKQFKSGAVFF